ncbi:Excinuclease ABC subunit C [Syntrophobotulus glycolicus DSM 8271]|uniref:UvrABC system protein C n=1 Tax=Syntrophobotulus glycolicus (strain DSM 8271 / FlGlyR) TaxID=645991 RepID=F0T0W7_SYNGF|nr:excinuclease ABC subunit UvrC [Syntrophobotulus glycolicus]ADY56256.1 Excinuclease ABC subunit C [Syntrophobotulus glycolicus DSM 8271]
MEQIKNKLGLLPAKPGVYLMKNNKNRIIYVGKAKILKNRVKSYFHGSHDQKTQQLVSQIADFEYIVTSSELEALVLECNLIKKYYPRYNIMLKDDKTYPYLLLTSEKHPRILVTRNVNRKMGKYFGPYPNATAAKETARLLNRVFPLRKCTHIPHEPCLYFHIGQCLGPCINQLNPEQYQDVLDKITSFLKGNQKDIIRWLEEKMNSASANLQFENAKEYRDLIQAIQTISEKQNITLNDFRNRDFVSYRFSDELLCIQIFYFRQGKLVARDNFLFPYYEEPEEAFVSFLLQYYDNKNKIPDEICLPENKSPLLNHLLPVTVPKRGKTLEIIKLATNNAETVLQERTSLEKIKTEKTLLALQGLGELLDIDPPQIIEAFDISSISGTNIVGGMVRFVQGKPCRSHYRKFNIDSSSVNDDTSSMKQVVFRRYDRLLSENHQIPDLILLDGGKGQITAALNSLDVLGLSIPLAGMVKNEEHTTRTLINADGAEIDLAKYPDAFRLIQQIQEEVHRFAITFHRQKRIKDLTSSELDLIPGVGPKRKRDLLLNLGSLANIKQSSVEDFRKIGLPENIALAIYSYFHGETGS